jgi:hypothetical protein
VSLTLPPRASSRTRELPDCCRIKFGGARQPVTRRTHSNLAVWISATLSYNIAKLTDEQRRALQLLAREHAGCAEVVLLAEGFSVGQLAELVIDGFAERQPSSPMSVVAKRSWSGCKSLKQGEQRSPIRGHRVRPAGTMARTLDGGLRLRGNYCGRVRRRLVGRHYVNAVEVVRRVEAANEMPALLPTYDDACLAAGRSSTTTTGLTGTSN